MDHPPETVHGTDRTGKGAGRSVLEGAFCLLDELTRIGEAGPTQLAASTGLPKATTHRLLDQLAALGAVHRQAGRYRIGPRMVQLGQAWQPAPLLRAAAWHPLRQLAAAISGANVNIAVPDSGRTLIVGGIRGEVDDIMPIRAGVLAPHGNAGDRIFAADAPAADYTAREWKRLVADARDQRLAFDFDLTPPAVHCPMSCVGAPVHGPSGDIIAAVAAVVLDSRRLASMATAVQHAARMVSANLARSGYDARRTL